MKYVLDASVAIKLVLGENDSDKAERLIEGARQRIHELIAPDFFLVECGHALFRAERKGEVVAGDARKGLFAIVVDCPALHASTALLARASAICQHLRKSFYDCSYMALAEQEGCQFVTADTKLVKAAHGHYPYVVDLASLP